MHWIFYLLMAISIIIIIISFIMSPESNGFSGALVGSSDLELFKNKKEPRLTKILKWCMFSLGISLMVGSLVARVFT
ncbi:MAG: preprotein translocase subunit SecG [Mollicutes bacterium PWAP]|nr:preprotein translocase subunit SecG [Mollicutes bacterium PWAP]